MPPTLRSALALACACLLGACAAQNEIPQEPKRRPCGNPDPIRVGDPVDLDGDCVLDGVAVDTDGDGHPDGVDTDADGIADQPLPGGPPLKEPDEEPVCPPENPFCSGDPDEIPDGCGAETFDLNPVGVNVMIAMDGSNSMNAFWTRTQEAIRDMILANPKQNYGVHLFWGKPVESFFEGIQNFNFCGSTQNEVLEPAPNQQTKVLPFMGPQAPGQGNVFFDFTPVIDPLNYYLEHTTTLEDPRSTNYLVFISDGNDNCFGTAFASRDSKKLAYEKLAVELVKKNIRVVPIGFDASSNQMTWNGSNTMTNFEALDILAAHGGTGLDKALAADNDEQLKKALQTVAQRVRPCRFQIPATLDPSQNLNPFELNFVLGGKLVPREREQKDGWNFVNGNTSEVEFYGQACEAIRFGTKLEARRGCSSEVCGTAATRVSTKPRAVEYLLDRSLTMTECSVSGDLACAPKRFCDFTGICAHGGGQLSWWGLMTKAIGTSVVATVNDDVEFGLRLFPSAQASDVCDVAEMPDVAPAQGTELSIIRTLLSNLPFGFATPLVDGLETIARTPGRLADDEVSGAVIVVSDGGDASTCGIEHADAVARLSAAAAALHQKGIKTYVIRFGTRDGASDLDDELLRAIVENGGTAVVDPQNPDAPPFYEAPDEATLNDVLAGISESLATCSFKIEDVEDDVDKEQVNLYLNGELIPYDAADEKREGWGFVDAEKTEISMYGEACTAFKNNRATSIVIEFGCPPVVVF